MKWFTFLWIFPKTKNVVNLTDIFTFNKSQVIFPENWNESSKSKLALLHIFRESNQIIENVNLTEFLSNNRLRDCEWVMDLYFMTKSKQSKFGNNMHLWSEWNWWVIVGTSVRIIYASIHRSLNLSRTLLALIWDFSIRFILSVLKWFEKLLFFALLTNVGQYQDQRSCNDEGKQIKHTIWRCFHCQTICNSDDVTLRKLQGSSLLDLLRRTVSARIENANNILTMWWIVHHPSTYLN